MLYRYTRPAPQVSLDAQMHHYSIRLGLDRILLTLKVFKQFQLELRILTINLAINR